MKERLKLALMKLDIYDHVRIIKDLYLKNKIEKELFTKRYNFYKQFIKPGDLCFDIGANYGNRTEIFLLLNAKVVAVEPQPKAISYLKRRFKSKIKLMPIALGATCGKSEMFVSKDNPLSSLSSEWIESVSKTRFNHVTWDKRIEVQILTLDRLIEMFGKPFFCKIDVEGFELEVLKGLSVPIKLISFEFTIPEFVDKAIECINILKKLGNIECNYSQGETLQFGLTKWLNVSQFIERFTKLPEVGVVDGDIYIRFLDS